MRIGTDDKLWVVVDPTGKSTLGDILFEASLRDLELHFRGGLKVEHNPTIFTDRAEAEREAQGRMLAQRATQAMERGAGVGQHMAEARRIALLNREGKVVLETAFE